MEKQDYKNYMLNVIQVWERSKQLCQNDSKMVFYYQGMIDGARHSYYAMFKEELLDKGGNK